MRCPLRKVIFADPSKCVGCGICELACAEYHEKKYGLKFSRIRNVKIGHTIRVSVTCRFCEKPPCVASCPRNALRSNENGVISVDEERCTGCGWCIVACDLGLMLFHPTKRVPITCDLCDGEPQCIKLCPKEALELTTLDAISSKVRMSTVKELILAAEEARVSA